MSFKPSSLVDIIGLLSSSPMPARVDTNEDDEPVLVPCIHVLSPPTPAYLPSSAPSPISDDMRANLLAYLSTAFDPPDPIAADYLLLLLSTLR